MEQRIQQLKMKIAKIQKWKEENNKVQLRFPVGEITNKIIKTDLIESSGELTSTLTVTHMIEVINPLDNKVYWVYAVLDN